MLSLLGILHHRVERRAQLVVEVELGRPQSC
jgi:hypothetical protein